MSLLDALAFGGFIFPVIDPNSTESTYSMRDADGELLGQRKNQLLRRVRGARKKGLLDNEEQENDESDTFTATTRVVNDASKPKQDLVSSEYNECSLTVKRNKSIEA